MNRTTRLLAATFLMTSAVAGFAVAAEDYVILKVNNANITASEVQDSWKTMVPDENTPAFADLDEKVRQNVLRGIASERLILDEAVKQGVDKSEAVQKQVEILRKKIIVKQFLEAKTADMVKEADIKKEYDRIVAGMKDEMEVRARHILVATEKEAKALKARLDKGKVSEPVKSSFGWHIIKLEDKRRVAPPTYSEIKPRIKAMLQEKALGAYIEQLITKSDLKYFDASGKEKPFEKLPKEVGKK